MHAASGSVPALTSLMPVARSTPDPGCVLCDAASHSPATAPPAAMGEFLPPHCPIARLRAGRTDRLHLDSEPSLARPRSPDRLIAGTFAPAHGGALRWPIRPGAPMFHQPASVLSRTVLGFCGAVSTLAFAADPLDTVTITASPIGDGDSLATLVETVDRDALLQSGGASLGDALAACPASPPAGSLPAPAARSSAATIRAAFACSRTVSAASTSPTSDPITACRSIRSVPTASRSCAGRARCGSAARRSAVSSTR